MKITSLADNYVRRTGLLAEHGFSVCIETDNRLILVDTGQSDIFLKNAARLGIEADRIEALVITHGHYDHTGGASAFLSANKDAVVYAKKALFKKRFHGDNKYIGVPEELWRYRNRFTFIDADVEIARGIHLVTGINIVFPEDSHIRSFMEMNGEQMVQDLFDDELFIVIEEEERISLISACSHNGISNMTETAVRKFNKPVHLVLGGFHLRNEPELQIEAGVDRLLAYHPAIIAVSHCTGMNGYFTFLQKAGGTCMYFAAGDSLSW